MKELAQITQLRTCTKVFLESIEKPRGLYLCWQEPLRLGYLKIDSDVGTPQYLKFTAVSEVKALAKYLFAASNNSIFFWAPENPQSPPSVFIELSKDARIISFTFNNGRFLLLWTIDFVRKIFVTLTNKKAQILAQREVSSLAVFDLNFLDLSEPPFVINTGLNRVWVSLSDGSLWTAALEDDSLAEFVKLADLHSPAVWISQASDIVHIVSCLGRLYSVTSSLEIHERSCVAPALRILQIANSALLVTPLDSFILDFDDEDSSRLGRSKWHGVLSSAKRPGSLDEIICVFRSGKICSSTVNELLSVSSPENDSTGSDPWAKLEKMADLRESRALAQISEVDSVQRQMALLMYLKFNALNVGCRVTQQFYPSLTENQIVSCELEVKEAFDASMWVLTLVLKPHGRAVAMSKSVRFDHEGTSVSLQFECPSSILLNLRIYLTLRSRLLPRTLSLMIHEKDFCSLDSNTDIPNSGFLVHQPSMECCVGQDLQSFLRSLVCCDKELCTVSMVGKTQLARITLNGANKRRSLSLRAVLLKHLLRATFSTEPKLLVPKSMEQTVKASKEQLLTCETMKALITFYEQWRMFTMKLPLL